MSQPAVDLVADGVQPRSTDKRPLTQVAVGILVQADGQFLLTSRPAGKSYAGYWEFPGGKVESGETLQAALVRELREEIGIEVQQATPWRTLVVDYPHALVQLHFFKVSAWAGTLHMHEGQQFVWQHLPTTASPILPGTVPVLKWLAEEAQLAAAATRA